MWYSRLETGVLEFETSGGGSSPARGPTFRIFGLFAFSFSALQPAPSHFATHLPLKLQLKPSHTTITATTTTTTTSGTCPAHCRPQRDLPHLVFWLCFWPWRPGTPSRGGRVSACVACYLRIRARASPEGARWPAGSRLAVTSSVNYLVFSTLNSLVD
jgi:hypothetical protein